MNTRPVTNLKSYRANLGGQFALMIREAGMVVPKGISMGAFALLRDMAAQDGIMPAATTTCAARAGAVCQPAKAMGIVIKAGWAGYVAPMKHYRLTPKGHAVLREATEKGLIRTLEQFERQLEQAAKAQAEA